MAAASAGRGADADGLHDAVARRGRPRSASRRVPRPRLNDEFSGGEQKRAETLQLAVLQPEVRGPRRDRLRPRRRRAARRRPAGRGDDAATTDLGVLAITHYARLLTELRPDACTC